jgi:hypothetical protein
MSDRLVGGIESNHDPILPWMCNLASSTDYPLRTASGSGSKAKHYTSARRWKIWEGTQRKKPLRLRKGFARLETWVTGRTGHMGNTFRLRAGGVYAVEGVFGDGVSSPVK